MLQGFGANGLHGRALDRGIALHSVLFVVAVSTLITQHGTAKTTLSRILSDCCSRILVCAEVDQDLLRQGEMYFASAEIARI